VITVVVFSFVWGGFILNHLDNYAPWWDICLKDEFLTVLYFAPFVLMLNPLVVLAGGLLSSFWQDFLWGCFNQYGCLGYWMTRWNPSGYEEFWTLNFLGLNIPVSNRLYFISIVRLPLGLLLLCLNRKNRCKWLLTLRRKKKTG